MSSLSRYTASAVTPVLVSLTACASAPSGEASSHPLENVSPSASAAASTPGTAATSVVAPPSASQAVVPDVAQPSAAEWQHAETPKNWAKPQWAARDCVTQKVRDWVRISCRGLSHLSGPCKAPQTKLGENCFPFNGFDEVGATLRATRGLLLQFTVRGIENGAWLSVGWPERESEPRVYFQSVPHGLNLFPFTTPVTIASAFAANQSDERPAAANWLLAREVNMAQASTRPAGCSVRMLGSWLKVYCETRGSDQAPMLSAVVDSEGQYSEVLGLETMTYDHLTFELHMRRGVSQGAVLFFYNGDHGHLTIEWPSDKSRPTVISLDNSWITWDEY